MSERDQIRAYLLDRWRAVKADLDWIERMLADADREEAVQGRADPAKTEQKSRVHDDESGDGPGERSASQASEVDQLPRFQQGVGRYGKSVRVMVLEALRSNPEHWFTAAEVLHQVMAEVGLAADDGSLKNNVRTALYTLKKHHEAENDGQGGYRAVSRRDTDGTLRREALNQEGRHSPTS